MCHLPHFTYTYADTRTSIVFLRLLMVLIMDMGHDKRATVLLDLRHSCKLSMVFYIFRIARCNSSNTMNYNLFLTSFYPRLRLRI